MVIFDGNLQVATAQDLVGLGGAGSVIPSTDRIPLSVLRDIGDGYQLRLRIDFPTAVTSDATRAIQFLVATTTDTGFTNLVISAKTGAILAAAMTGAFSLDLPVPKEMTVRTGLYLFAGIEVVDDGGGDWVTGTCNMRFVIDSQSPTNKPYPASFTNTGDR